MGKAVACMKTKYSFMVAYKKSNFAFGFLFLSQERRNALKVLYAFFRDVDNIVDESSDPVRSRRLLDDWRAALYGDIGGAIDKGLARDLHEVKDRYQIYVKDLEDVIDGVAMDIGKKEYGTFEELRKYCYGVASAVGLACRPVFGIEKEKGSGFAVNLGYAFQLTNIIRDVGADAKRGYVYIPNEDIEKFAYSKQDLLNQKYNDKFVSLMDYQYERAEKYYQMAFEALPAAEQRNALAPIIMSKIYLDLLRKIKKKGFRVFSKKETVSLIRKGWLVAKALIYGK